MDCADTRSGFFQERCTLPRKNENRKFRMIRESNLKKRNQNIEVVLKCSAKHKLAWESLNIFFLRSIIRKVPFCKSKFKAQLGSGFKAICVSRVLPCTHTLFFFNLHKKDSLKWFKSIGQDNCFGLALLFVYKIFQQDNNNNNNNSNGNGNINNNNNNNNSNIRFHILFKP